jgi:signal transduction histidine kinase
MLIGMGPRAERRLTRALTAVGDTVAPVCVPSPESAELLPADLTVDVALLDSSQPAVATDVAAAIHRLRRRFPGVPVILFGWERGGDELLEALRMGADGVVDRATGPAALRRTLLGLQRGEGALSRRHTGALIAALRTQATAGGAGTDVGLEAALETALRQRDEALETISHDLGQPLSTLQVALPIIRETLETTHPDLRELLRSTENATARMSAMVRELLDVARLQAGESLRLHLDELDLVALVRDSIQLLRRSADITIRLVAPEPEIRGKWDGPRLERVVANLLDNAVKYSPDGGTITVRVSVSHAGDRPWALVEVADTGIGIPAGDLPRLFTRFHRGHNVGQARGTGLGLAGARWIIEQHGGTIGVASIEGEGTTVTVRLPTA